MSTIKPYLDKYGVSQKYPRIEYPNPWFDLSTAYLPKDMKTLFKYCRTFFYKNGFLNSVITKMAEYPITQIIFDTKLSDVEKQKYEQLFGHLLKIKSLLVHVGLDYMTYGNAFVSSNMKFNRYLKCPKCGHLHSINDTKYTWKNYEFHGTCSKCNQSVKFEVEDSYLKKPEFLKFIRWSPESIDIDYDDLTGETTYYYKIPAATRKRIQTGNKKTLKTIPYLFIEALKKNKKVELDTNNLYHFKRPALAEDNMGWGKPLILPALADIWYLQTLKRGNEAIAAEHIVPFRALYPASSGTVDPFTSINLSSWKNKLEYSMEKWKKDPNHIAIFPIPIGSQNIGGDGKMLMVTQEMKYIEETIINSLGVPLEFIKGGVSWSGSSVSLRIVENGFINYRTLMEDFVNYFVMDKVNKFLNYPKTSIHFKRLRMADDTETKRLAMELESNNKISTMRLLDDFGYDYEKEKEFIKESRDFNTEMEIKTALAQAEAQGKSMEISAKYNVRAQVAAEQEQAKLREEKFKEELSDENSQNREVDVSNIIDKYAEEMMLMPPEMVQQSMMQLQKKMPYTAAMIQQRLMEKGMFGQEQGGDNAPTEKKEKPTPKKEKKDEAEKKSQGHPKGGV